jgi:ABC-type multidrug transport system ATPase subunit
MFAIQTHHLTCRYSKEIVAVNSLCLGVPEQSIYCFLGPNGAGKTTTLRLLLGLIAPTTGDVAFFPHRPAVGRIEQLKRIGACIETPSLYHHLTAAQNLGIYAKIYQTHQRRIDEVLALVDLMPAKNKKVAAFSLGMKQRLSIAIALLHQPELVILDEPTNGLDPQGIVEIRNTIIQLNRQQGITFLISSHLLAEVEKLATHVGIIHHGTLRFEGSMAQLQAASLREAQWVVRTTNDQHAQELLRSCMQLESMDDHALRYPHQQDDLGLHICRVLHEHSIGVYEITRVNHDLESHFLQLIQNPTP